MVSNPDKEIKEENDKPFYCKFCGSENYIKYGKKNNKQQYFCKDCKRKFVDNLYFEKLKADPKIICLTLDLYFKGVSLRKICDHLKQFYELNVVHTTLLKWIRKYIVIMDEYVRQFKPQLSDIWNVDEMMINIKGEWHYLWNVIDDGTRFHLASYVSKRRTTNEAKMALRTARKRSHNKRPMFIITDGLKSYNKAISDEFFSIRNKTTHIGNVGIRGRKNGEEYFDNNLVERLQGTIRDRNKTQRGLKDQYSPFVRGHKLYYNFIKPHESLYNKTPAEIAGIDLELDDNKWENLLVKSLKYQNLPTPKHQH
jgi:transposase-like protein